MSSSEYWERRYAEGGTSGSGSEGANALFKARFINDFVQVRKVRDVVEYGCGDGRQLQLASYPQYTGLDVSPTAISICRSLFEGDTSKSFLELPAPLVTADLALSLDVIYHLIEPEVYMQHLADVFASALRWVILYTTDSDYIDVIFPDFQPADHVVHRPVEAYIRSAFPAWKLDGVFVDNLGLGGSDFYVYGRA